MKVLSLILGIGISLGGQAAAQAQPKPSAKVPIKDSFKMGRTIAVLSGATGYMRTDDGKWASSPNRIPYKNPDYNNPYYFKYPTGEENISEININEIEVLGEPYYLLTVHGIKGAWRDEKTMEDFYTFKACDYYVFHKPYLSRLSPDTLKAGKPYVANLRLLYSGTFRYNSYAQYLDKLDKRVRWNIVWDHPRDSSMNGFFTFTVDPVASRGGTVIHFNQLLSYAPAGEEPEGTGMYIFQEKYYSIPLEKWKKFISAK